MQHQTQNLLQHLGWGSAFGLPALALNLWLPLSLYGSLTLFLGPALVVLCLTMRGLWPALVAAAWSALGAYLLTSNPSFVISLLLEIPVLYWLGRRGTLLLVGAFLYWVFIGGVLHSAYNIFFIEIGPMMLLLVYLKLVLNGLLYAALAITIRLFIPYRWCDPPFETDAPRLSGRVFYLSFISLTIPALLITMFYSAQATRQVEEQEAQALQSHANALAEITDEAITRHQRAIMTLARQVELVTDSDQRQELLFNTARYYPGFGTMIMTNAAGDLLFGYPADSFAAMVADAAGAPNVADRSYFQIHQAGATEVYVSDVFQGRGFGTAPIIAISAPWYENGEFAGVVQGSVSLRKLPSFSDRLALPKHQHYTIMTDNQQQIIYASADFPLRPLDQFKTGDYGNVYAHDLPLTRVEGKPYLFEQQTNNYDWSIYVLTTPDRMTQQFATIILILLTVLISTALVFTVVARRFSHRITLPLERLSRRMEQSPESEVGLADTGIMSQEVKAIAARLTEARNVMVKFNQRLQAQVTEKTKELGALNQQLQKLAREDGLTGLLNRRSFDEEARKLVQYSTRGRMPFTLIMLDVDHFKSINDTYGHPVGDQCLKYIASTLREHFKRTSDLVGRYGGEEFAILTTGGQAEVAPQLTRLRQALHLCCAEVQDRIPITISVGCLSVEDNFRCEYQQLVAQADRLLYTSKHEGRDKVRWEQW